MSETTITYTGSIVVTHCWCGIQHGVPKDLYDHVQSQHRNGERQTSIYCPLGHRWGFAGKSQVEKEREARERAEWRAANAETRRQMWQDQAETAERRRRAAKGQLTKTKKRIANGVCPCCNRTFTNLADHMSSKHPTYVEPTTGASE